MVAMNRGSTSDSEAVCEESLVSRPHGSKPGHQELRGMSPPKTKQVDHTVGENPRPTKSEKRGDAGTVRRRVRHAVDLPLAMALSQMKSAVFFYALVALALQVPAFRATAEKFVRLQGSAGGNSTVATWDDAYFVLTAIVSLIFARAVVFTILIKWVAPAVGLHHKNKAVVRFAEQGWCLLFYSVYFVIGVKLLAVGGYTWSDPAGMWQGFPHIFVDYRIKAYYLVALASWLSQLYIINVEQRRKDHYQMFTHHIVTCLLIIGSYANYFTRIGHIVMVLMDVVDAQLSFAKILKYLGFEKACDVAFLAFLVGWILCRHVLYMYQTWYAVFEAPKTIQLAPCAYNSAGEVLGCFEPKAHATFAILLLVLQGITLVWLYMILRVVVKVIRGTGAEDTRSDDEDEDEDDDTEL